MGTLQAENAGLACEILASREDLRTANFQREQFRMETTDMLSHLSARVQNDRADAVQPGKRLRKRILFSTANG
jgi:hypothetical protein